MGPLLCSVWLSRLSLAALLPLLGFFLGLFPLNYVDPDGHDPWWVQSPWYQGYDASASDSSSLGYSRQGLRVRQYLGSSTYSPDYGWQNGRSYQSPLDGKSVLVAQSGSFGAVSTIGGVEVLYNYESKDVTVFGVVGAEVNVVSTGVEVVTVAQINNVYNIGDNNLNYAGPFVHVAATGAVILGGSGGFAYTPQRQGEWWNLLARFRPDSAGSYSRGIGPAVGLGGSIALGQTEYIPLITAHPNGSVTHHAAWYLYNNEQRGVIANLVGVAVNALFAETRQNFYTLDWEHD